MKKIYPIIIVSLYFVIITGCNPSESKPIEKITIIKEYNFEKGDEGFITGFADIPEDYMNNAFSLEIGYCNRPSEKDKISKGIILKGHNRSDDMFLYTYKKLDKNEGIEKNTTYHIKLQFDIGTSVARNLFGIGGSPGQSVSVKAGVVSKEPGAKLDKEKYYRLNLDKGNGAFGGKDIIVIGNVEKTPEMSDDGTIEYKNFDMDTQITSNNKGECYIIIGYDSGFEGLNWHYVDNIKVELTKVEDLLVE